MRKLCSVTSPYCGRPAKARGWCNRHYMAALRHEGDPLGGQVEVTPRGEALAFYSYWVDEITDECVIWPYGTTKRGYGCLWMEGRLWNVHRLACERRYGPPPQPGMEVAHGPCNNPACFNGGHLSWKTHTANCADKYRDGTLRFGENSPTAKLTETEVLEIKARYAAGGVYQRMLADEYGISNQQVSDIISGKRWAHLTNTVTAGS